MSERATTATTRAPATSLLTAITAIAVPVVLTGTALIVLAQVWIVDVGYALPGFPDDGLGMADGVRRDLADTGIRAVAPWDGTGIARLEGARLASGEAAFGPRGNPLADVRAVMTGFLWAWLAGVAVLCACAVALRGAGSRALARGLRTGVWISVGAYLVAGLLMLADFDRFFESFHSVFFTRATRGSSATATHCPPSTRRSSGDLPGGCSCCSSSAGASRCSRSPAGSISRAA